MRNSQFQISKHAPLHTEIFIDTIITNNEERTVEQAARRLEPSLTVKQYRYVGLQEDRAPELLSQLSFFNPNKEIAYVRRNGSMLRFERNGKKLVPASTSILSGISLLRRDQPDTRGSALGKGCETGICYDCRDISDDRLRSSKLCEVFCNPNSSTLETLSS